MRRTRPVLCLLALLAIQAPGLPAQELRGDIHRAEDCCNIVSVDQASNEVLVREIATGLTKTLTITNSKFLLQLRPGMTYGPGSVAGIQESPANLEPNWLEDCCNFRVKAKGSEPQHTLTQQIASSPLGATAAMTVDLDPGVTVRIDSLKRAGSRAVRIDLSIQNSTGGVVYLNRYGSLVGYPNESMNGISIVDYEGGLRYGTIRDSEGVCACSRKMKNEIQSGEQVSYWALITAPPEDVTTVSIDLAGAALLDDVRIE